MNKKNIDFDLEEDREDPGSFDEELAKIPPPSKEELRRYDYMKEDFLQRLRPAQEPVIDLVFSLAGKVLRWAGEVVADLSVAPLPAMAGARSAAGPPRPATPAWQVVGRGWIQAEADWIEVATIIEGGKRKLLVNLVDAVGKDIRPLELLCSDQDRQPLLPRMTLRTGEFFLGPDPEPGVYLFDLRWNDGRSHKGITLAYEA